MKLLPRLINTKLLLMTVVAITMFVGCQEGYDETEEPDESIAISANDNIVDLIQKVVLKDGSFDNIIDHCSEVSIKYPYSVRINEELIDVRSIEDVESIKLNYFDNRDDIEINYPVALVYSDYSESVISNVGELKKIQKRHNANLVDDDIESIDFIYPIEISMYNRKYQKANVIVVRNDYEMHRVFSNMDDLIVELGFPLVVETLNKERITLENNNKLEKEIKNVVGKGNEDDKFEFGNEDYPHKEVLTVKDWKVLQYIDSKNETSLFYSYVFDFKKDNTVQVNTPTGKVSGVWEIIIHGKQKILKTDFDTEETPLVWLNNSWQIKNNSPMIINMEVESDSHGKNSKFTLEAIEH